MSAQTTLKLLRTALGDPEFSKYIVSTNEPGTYFQLYQVSLPTSRFRGLPPDWLFAVLDSDTFRHQGSSRAAVNQEAQRLVDTRRSSDLLFLISAESGIHLNEDFASTEDRVFCLDAPNVSRSEPSAMDGRLSPFVTALQRRGLADQPLSIFSPYQRNHPATGWRFFGRKKEVRKLIDGHENFIIVGARRMGKTSLMNEAARLLEQRGEKVHYVSVVDCRTPEQASATILQALSTQARVRAVRHGEALSQRPLAVALHEMTSTRERTTLLLDELGYVIASLHPEAQVFLSLLRKHTQAGNLRIIISCFEEVFVRQQTEFTGPLVNFGNTLRIEPFSDTDVEEIVFAPLEIWKPLQSSDKQKLKKIISATIGHHPLFIQVFCLELFSRATYQPESLVQIASSLIGGEMAASFQDAVRQIFWGLPRSLPKYLFLLRCREAHDEATELWQAELDDDWLIERLKRLGFSALTDARRAILEGLEVHGLCSAIGFNRTRQRIAVPIVYRYIKEVEHPVTDLINKLAADVEKEQSIWGLTKV